jgi:predicted permease
MVSLELPLLLLVAGLVLGLIAWLLGTFTQFLRPQRYRVTLGLIAFVVSGFMGFISTLNAISALTDWLADKSPSVALSVGLVGYVLFGFLGCWTAVRLGGRMDRKHTLSVLYNLVKEQKEREPRA